MSTLVVRGGAKVSGSVVLPGDKSIAHRALMLGATATGRTTVRNLPSGADVASTMACLEGYGVRVEHEGDSAAVHSRGIEAWVEPDVPLFCGNSGTTMRILAGLAARCDFTSIFDGDASLRRRPMARVGEPLRALGATVSLTDDHAPFTVRGGSLRGTAIRSGVASAQVKSSIVFAALGADGASSVTEPFASRDHTERMLGALGASVNVRRTAGGVVTDVEPFDVPAFDLAVCGDVSSAAFIVAAGVLAGSVSIDGVGLNPSRIGFLEAVARMGGDVSWEAIEDRMGEPVGRIDATLSGLRAIEIDEVMVPTLHDELPILGVLATQAEGTTIVRGAEELRVKESDRIASLATGLRVLGGDIEELDDGFIIHGPTPLQGGTVESAGDHRMALAFAVAGLVAKGDVIVEGFESAAVSWPAFENVLSSLGAEVDLT